MKIRQKNNGFTLVEMLVVISIVSTLSSVVLSAVNSARIKARNLQRLSNAEAIARGFQIATTATTNQFPSTDTNWSCLGRNVCYPGTYVNNPAVDNLLKTGMAGGEIPLDPLWNNGPGDSFLYHSNEFYYGVWGAYLLWYGERDSGSPPVCGRAAATILTHPYYMCMLYLGPPTP